MTTGLDISAHLHIRQGFCHPDWQAISEWVEQNLPEAEWNSAWGAASQLWLDRIRATLGGAYQINETQNFLILSEAPARVIRDVCRSCEEALKRILHSLRGVAIDEGYGKHVVLMFSSLEDYYGYVMYFYPEGDHPMSGGLCLSGEGYLHFAIPTTDYSSYRSTLVHELTHGCVEHLPLPSWLNEAIAMRMEEAICGSEIFHLDQEMYERHLAYWDEKTIQQFWTGESWEIPGDSFELSYNLAQILWRKIENDLGAPSHVILDFVSTADFQDGGEAACRALFDLSLGDLLTDFLGEGSWMPSPQNWPGATADQAPPAEAIDAIGRTIDSIGI